MDLLRDVGRYQRKASEDEDDKTVSGSLLCQAMQPTRLVDLLEPLRRPKPKAATTNVRAVCAGWPLPFRHSDSTRLDSTRVQGAQTPKWPSRVAGSSPSKPTPSYGSEAHRLFLDSITKRRSFLSNPVTHQHRVDQAIATAIGILFKTDRAPSISTRAIGSSTDQSRSSDFDGQRSALLFYYYSILRLPLLLSDFRFSSHICEAESRSLLYHVNRPRTTWPPITAMGQQGSQLLKDIEENSNCKSSK